MRTANRETSGPHFYVTARQPPSPAAVILAILIAGSTLSAVALGLGHRKARHFAGGDSAATRTPGGAAGSGAAADEDDDPSQIDTIVLGDAADAPVPARKSDRISNVHATILIRLPRYGPDEGLIPDSPAGHLLYRWLAAFNQASEPALQVVLPNQARATTAAAQMDLRRDTGGFALLSAREVQPGLLVFRLRDQTPAATEVLGTLRVRAGSSPAAIGNLSLRAVPQAAPGRGAVTATPQQR